MAKNPYEQKVTKTWTIDDINKELDRLHKESRRLGIELEAVAHREGWGKATTTIDVAIEDILIATKKLRAYRDFWLKYKRRPSDAEVDAAIR